MTDSSNSALASSNESFEELNEIELPTLEKRTSSKGPRNTYMVSHSEEYKIVDTVKPVVNLSKNGVNVFVRFRPDND